MKKWIAILLCVCVLSVTASASDDAPDFMAEYVALFGEAPVAANFSSDEEYQASYAVWLSALENYVFLRSEAYEQQKAEEAVRKAAEVERASAPPESAESAFSNNESAEAEETTTSSESIESAGTNHETDSSVSFSPGPVNQYPDRVRVDLAGNIWSLDGELLSPGTTPAMEPASAPDEDAALLSDELADPDNLPAVADPDTLAVIAGLVSDIATDPPVWYVEDLRPVDPPAEVLTGLKSLVTSIFGEYTPVTTTSVISETVGNDTYQYLVETVAPGAAGVDYEWVAGVLLFAILLYCFMKLLGGVLK